MFLDGGCADLVLRTVSRSARCVLEGVSGQMTLVASLAGLFGVAASAIVLAGVGCFFLHAVGFSPPARPERFLFALALGSIFFTLLVSTGELWPDTRFGVTAAVVLAAVLGTIRAGSVLRTLRQMYRRLRELPQAERWMAAALAAVLLWEGLAAMAPLTGSDALHYHFTAQKCILSDGFHSSWFLSHSFFSGLSHQLILAGLALGSEKLALGWIFLGGAAAALATAQLTRQWVDGPWPWIAALAFLLTPVVFWQTTTAGAPDIWMAFLVPLAVLAILRAKEHAGWKSAVLAGILAGGVAGAKYTGIVFAACLLLAFVVEVRKLSGVLLFLASSVLAGIWPYLRNWKWSGDPVFPFLVSYIAPERLNSFALASYLADTGASAPRSFWQVLKFPFFSAVDPANLGFWQMLGPLVLCLAPLVVLSLKNTPLWRTAATVWVCGALGIGLISGMTRFLLPLLPVALAACVGAVGSNPRGFRAARLLATLSIAAFLITGLAGLCLYARHAWSAAAGFTPREDYLRRLAPDYARSEFLNQQLAGQGTGGKVLVFFHHVYYLRVPFVFGNPEASWAVDPSRLQMSAAWMRLFRENGIRWVARGPQFPRSLREPLERLEAEKVLLPCASGQVEDWHGNRIGGARVQESITLDCVQY